MRSQLCELVVGAVRPSPSTQLWGPGRQPSSPTLTIYYYTQHRYSDHWMLMACCRRSPGRIGRVVCLPVRRIILFDGTNGDGDNRLQSSSDAMVLFLALIFPYYGTCCIYSDPKINGLYQ